MADKKVSWFTIATNDDHPMNLEMLKSKCTKWAYNHHNKGIDESHPHIHFVGYLNANSRTTIKYIAQWAGLAENMVEIVHSVYGILEYLTHANQPEKEQYTADSVQASFDWQQLAEKEKNKAIASENDGYLPLESLATYVQPDKDGIVVNSLAHWVDNGTIRPYNYHEFITSALYSRVKDKLRNMWEYYELKNRKADRQMKTLFFYGPAGSGKTTMAKEMARMSDYADSQIFVSNGGANVLDGYSGEPVVILDDLRDSVLALADFLKLTDNHTNSMVHARYYDKYMTHCKVLMVTSCVPLHEWYSNALEDRNQLYRRFPNRIECVYLDRDTSVVKYRLFEWKKDSNMNVYPYQFMPVTLGDDINPLTDFLRHALRNSRPTDYDPTKMVDVTDSNDSPF